MSRFDDVPEELNQLGTEVIGTAIALLKDYGPGMLEEPYRLGLAQRLADRGHAVRLRVPLVIAIEGGPLTKCYEMDVVVDEKLVIETKSVAEIHLRHIMQAKTYVRTGGYQLGYVLNFGRPRLGIKRIVP